MRMPFRRRAETAPQLPLTSGERAVAGARVGDRWLAVTTTRVVLVEADGGVALARPWHDVDGAGWDPDGSVVTVSWVDGSAPVRWVLTGPEGRLPEALRERVEASVLLSVPLGLPGGGRAGRVVLRRDLATDEPFVQVVLGAHTSPRDPEVAAAVRSISADLREQAGLG